MESVHKAVASVVILLAIVGFFTIGSWFFSDSQQKTPDYLRDLPVMQFNREVITQQGQIIEALQAQNQRVQQNLENTVANANDIIARLQGADEKTTESAANER